MDTLYTFGDNFTHYKTESVYFWGLMNSANKVRVVCNVGGLARALSGLGSWVVPTLLPFSFLSSCIEPE